MATPGLLFVNSKIKSPDYSVESFTKWYEDVHIRDIFMTSGIKSAFRYKSPTPDAVDRPFLALYPLKALEFLQTAEFKAIPVTDDSIPSESHTIFDLADFDTRYYELLERYPGEVPNGPLKTVLTVCFDSTSEEPKKLYQESLPVGAKPARSRLYKLNFARQNRKAAEDKTIPDPPKYLALHEFSELPQKNVDDTKSSLAPAKVAAFDIWKAFGDVNVEF